jgi:hypothetical protein
MQPALPAPTTTWSADRLTRASRHWGTENTVPIRLTK